MGRPPTDTKTKLLHTANDLIWQSSYGHVSVDDICNTAGVKKGSFYHYFSSKVELAVAVMEEAYHDYALDITAIFTLPISPIERFESFADFIYNKQKQANEQYGRVCGCPFASLGSEMAGNEALIQKKADEILNRQGTIFKDTLQQMVDSGLLPEDTDIANTCTQIIASILGQVMMARIQNNLNNLHKNVRLGLFQAIGLKTLISETNPMLQEQ